MFLALLPVIGYALELFILIWKEISGAQARARAKGEKLILDRKMFWEASDKALAKLREDARKEHDGISDVEDQVDHDTGPK